MSCRMGAMLRLAGRVHRLVRVLYEALSSADGTRDVETMVEIPQVLRRLECFLERRLREAQRGAQPFELALIDLARRHGRKC